MVGVGGVVCACLRLLLCVFVVVVVCVLLSSLSVLVGGYVVACVCCWFGLRLCMFLRLLLFGFVVAIAVAFVRDC